MEDATMRAAAPGATLGQLWAQLVAQYGAFQSIGGVTTTAQAPYTIAAVPTQFANSTVTLTVAVSSAGQVSGLHVAEVAPSASSPASSPAAYVNRAAFTEGSVTVGSAPWALPGTLSLPNGAGPFPAIVLVQGSGPNDRDETFGPNKPFRDLAWGLASAGIAVLRYDKRTFVYSAQMAADTSITVRQETTDDAMAAVTLLRKTPKVDPARVFLVGHSLGAYLAPRIAAQVPGQLAGIAMLEAPSTPLVQLILIQEQYLASLQGSPSPQVEQQLANLKAQVALAESPSLSPSTPASELPLNTPASYWLDLRTYHALTVGANLTIPMFFSQGGRDYQVPPSELQPWETALAGHSNATFKTYPAMDHLLLDGGGPATPAEYSMPGHVDAQLVADVAAWVHR
jgi:dienelactone hydrolase